MKYYPHHIGDFDRATRHLTRIERSVYRDLIEVYYDTEQPLTLDLNALCRKIIARSDEERTAVEQVLNEFFTQTERGWYHDRCEEEIEAYRNSTSQKSAAGKASAAKRAQKRQQALNGSSTAVGTPVPQTSNGDPTNQEPRTKNQEPEEETNVAQDAPSDDDGKPDPVRQIFEHWQTVMETPRSALDDKRRKLIRNALKMGYTVEQLCEAIDGCRKSPYHMGQNENRMKYNGLDLILRNADKIDKFIVIGRSPLVPPPAPAGRPSGAMLRQDEIDYSSNKQYAAATLARVGGVIADDDPIHF